MFKEITITKEFQKFSWFVTLFGQTLGVFTVEYDGKSQKKINKFAVFF